MRGRPGAGIMAGLTARIDEMNRLADQSHGFVWRLAGSEATPEALRVFADFMKQFDLERLFYNLSVWETLEDLRRYTFGSAHAEMLRRKQEWIESFNRPHLALWWIPVGHIPSVAESAERLRSVRANGATPFAFTFGECFPEPSTPPPRNDQTSH